ncbi:hypothetical protein PSAC2689_70240 [Paraburkholderia sacchari]
MEWLLLMSVLPYAKDLFSDS